MMDVHCIRMYCEHQMEITNYKDHTNSSNNQVNELTFFFMPVLQKSLFPFLNNF